MQKSNRKKYGIEIEVFLEEKYMIKIKYSIIRSYFLCNEIHLSCLKVLEWNHESFFLCFFIQFSCFMYFIIYFHYFFICYYHHRHTKLLCMYVSLYLFYVVGNCPFLSKYIKTYLTKFCRRGFLLLPFNFVKNNINRAQHKVLRTKQKESKHESKVWCLWRLKMVSETHWMCHNSHLRYNNEDAQSPEKSSNVITDNNFLKIYPVVLFIVVVCLYPNQKQNLS